MQWLAAGGSGWRWFMLSRLTFSHLSVNGGGATERGGPVSASAGGKRGVRRRERWFGRDCDTWCCVSVRTLGFGTHSTDVPGRYAKLD